MTDAKSTLFDRQLQRIKNHKLLSSVMVLGVAVLAIGSLTDALTKIGAYFATDVGRFKVTDVLVLPGEEGTRILDFRLLNNSSKTVTVSRLKVKAVSFEFIPPPPSASEISARYDLDLSDLRIPGASTEIPVAHVLESGKDDRFTVTVSVKRLHPLARYTWRLKPTLVTSQGSFDCPEVVVSLP